jgi:hypothetical protein
VILGHVTVPAALVVGHEGYSIHDVAYMRGGSGDATYGRRARRISIFSLRIGQDVVGHMASWPPRDGVQQQSAALRFPPAGRPTRRGPCGLANTNADADTGIGRDQEDSTQFSVLGGNNWSMVQVRPRSRIGTLCATSE